MVLLVADVNEPQRVRRHPPRVAEPPVPGPLAAEGPQEVARGVEHLHAVVVPVGDDVLPDPVDRHPGQAVELGVAVAVPAEGEGVPPVGGEDLQ